ncbi:MAG: hypothetical protein ACAH95_00890 [Fimbriimonas sp.]
MVILKFGHATRRRVIVGAASMCVAAASWGQSSSQSAYLISGSTSTVPIKGQFEIRLDGRFFKGDENNTYIGANLIYGLGDGLAIAINGGFAPKKTQMFGLVGIRTGGNDFEVQAKYRIKEFPGLALALGISAPSTPKQTNTFITGRATFGGEFKGLSAYAGVAGVFKSDANLAAITFGGESTPNNGFSIVGELNLIVSGNNTFDRSGNLKRVSTYGLAARYRMPNDPTGTSIMIGWTNALGSTTGFSLSPGLNNSGALFLGVTFIK